ncbi:hypothetical protein SMU52_02663 [Streptococcus mutans NFSM2]|nr:hypothetical protein SMU10_06787 [Streptococcus mutans 8ID3]EMB82374.1 hypothetical protein SMU52_02663 [Streptococcus mutans NFSM2]EMC15880.1 hypothetical protein SMU76_00075 [Streptococcus mutans N66]EMC60806.1 hypothetical protein SMU101_09185 [Streptococcus mutans U2B]
MAEKVQKCSLVPSRLPNFISLKLLNKDKFLAKFDNKFYNTKALPLGGNHVNY